MKLAQHTTGDDGSQGITDIWWFGQSFTALATSILSAVKMKLYKGAVGIIGYVPLEIKAADADDKPTGAVLSTGQVNFADILQGEANAAWYEIVMSTYQPLASSKYVLYGKTPAGAAGNWLGWRRSSNSGYAGGKMCWSTTNGATWTTSATMDFMFEILGIVSLVLVGTTRHNKQLAEAFRGDKQLAEAFRGNKQLVGAFR